jgi:hypothetical protein
MDDMDPPGCPDPARVVIFNMSPLANLASSDSLFRETSSNLSTSNLFSLISSLRANNGKRIKQSALLLKPYGGQV